jgi:pimeloyl-ACP methyl ester carboxylesterase
LDPGRLLNLAVPTLLVLDGDSTAFYTAATEALHESLPGSRIAVLPGQRHDGAITAPALFLREVMELFLDAD